MEKKFSFYIKSLDKGYILTKDGKTKALESSGSVKEDIITALKMAIERLGSAVVRNMLIKITVEENLPECETKD